MREPVDIKIAHINKAETTSNSINKELVFEILGRSSWDALAPFYKFQQAWVNTAYNTFKDFDIYLILMYLKQKIYVDYSDRFHYMSVDAFYSQDKISIDRINLIQISKSLNIPKETIRRKINYLQERDIIFRSGKSIYLNSRALEIIKPINTLPMLAIFFEKMSIILSKENWFGRPIKRENIEQFIKDHFTVCWEYFYRFQIPYLTRHRIAFGDLESWNTWGSIAIVQTSAFAQNMEKVTREELTTYEDYYFSMLKYKCERGINASSIADISGIPRATVIRKLRTLEKKGFIRRNKKLEYTLGQAKNLKKFQTNYLINQKNLSDYCTTMFNLMKNSKFKID
ncbi:helix-turn-helix domain-containing protein [Pelagibacteraceae bacterium]|nr:helix-turn-helix domain-containing protein [Pelagibacteraceae bacterium]